MILINEFLPNPSGSDAEGEWLELWNDGDVAVDLSGWRVATESGKSFYLSGKIPAKGYLVVPRKISKLTLRNGDGGIYLYDKNGGNAGSVSFYGVAPEGKSWSRISSGGAEKNFLWTEPTPSGENSYAGVVEIIKNDYPLGASLNVSFGAAEFIGTAAGVALVLAGLILFIVIKNERLQKLFFGRNEAIR